MDVLALICLIFAAIPFGMTLINLVLYRPLPSSSRETVTPLSVLIPARNEEHRIKPVLEALLQNPGDSIEFIIGDDGSTDATAEIVNGFAARDARLRLLSIEPRPTDQGWAGKNNGCYQLAQAARHDLLVFIDADIVVAPDALNRIAGYMERNAHSALLSGFPKQITGSFWERLLIPLIHFLLLGFLPFIGVKFTRHPMFGTACGQLIAVRKEPYFAVEGHYGFRNFLHDGLHLPRRLRAAGHHTALADFTDIAATRMYDNAADLRTGLKKNAHEAMATPVALPIWTAMLVLGQVLPLLLVWLAPFGSTAATCLIWAIVLGFFLRAVLAVKFQQSWLGVLLHPIGILALVHLQWNALIARRRGGKVRWKGREY